MVPAALRAPVVPPFRPVDRIKLHKFEIMAAPRGVCKEIMGTVVISRNLPVCCRGRRAYSQDGSGKLRAHFVLSRTYSHLSGAGYMTNLRWGRYWSIGGWSLAFFATTLLVQGAFVEEYKSGIVWPEPKLIDPGPVGGPPSDAKVLFDGKSLAAWHDGEKWEIKDGYAVAREAGITTKEEFGDCQLHIEWASPAEVSGEGQGRGNSGVYLMGRYELQILDSYHNPTYFDGQAGSIYKQHPPLVNACRKPGEWQAYDVIFTAPRFDEQGGVKKPASITVLHNGVVVQNHFELQGGTFYERPPMYETHGPKGPIHLQFHGNPVRFRNIWIRETAELEGKKGG
jgi:hypothetical protein